MRTPVGFGRRECAHEETARVTSAVLDRLLHHAETVTLEGNSFRMKDVIDK